MPQNPSVLQSQHQIYRDECLNFINKPFHCGSDFKLTTEFNDFRNDCPSTVIKCNKSRLIVVL